MGRCLWCVVVLLASGCAALEGVPPKDVDLIDMDLSTAGKSGAGTDGMPISGSSEGRDRVAALAPDRPPPPKRRNSANPQGTNMDVYKRQACYADLRKVAADPTYAAPTRALAEAVLDCDSENGHYDIRHAPCPIFGADDNEATIDRSIDELAKGAHSCLDPGA